MRSLNWGLALGLLNFSIVLASDSNVVTVRINTGVCAPSGSPNSGGPGGNGAGGNGNGYGGNGNGNGGNGNGGNGSGNEGGNPGSINSPNGVYNYLGIYNAPGSGGDLLDGAGYSGGDVTVSNCALFCDGTAYFALSGGDKCSCGDNEPSTPKYSNYESDARGAAPSVCDHKCSGDADECCGYGNSYIVYARSPKTSGSGSPYQPSPTYTGSATHSSPVHGGSTPPTTTTPSNGGGNGGSYGGGNNGGGNGGNSGGGGDYNGGGGDDDNGGGDDDNGGGDDDNGGGGDDDNGGGDDDDNGGGNDNGGGDDNNGGGGDDNNGGSGGTGGNTNPTYPTENPITDDPVCPTNNYTLYTDTYENEYDIRCGIEVIGAQYAAIYASTFVLCLQYCSILGECAGVTYQVSNDPNSGNCYPYSTFVSYGVQRPYDLYSGRPTQGPTPLKYPAETTCTTDGITTSSGNTYTTGCDENLPGADIRVWEGRSLQSCTEFCSLVSNCVGVDYTPYDDTQKERANCYPKSSNGGTPTPQQGTEWSLLQS